MYGASVIWDEAYWIHAMKGFKRQAEAWDPMSASIREPSKVLSRWVAWPDWPPGWWSTSQFLPHSLLTSAHPLGRLRGSRRWGSRTTPRAESCGESGWSFPSLAQAGKPSPGAAPGPGSAADWTARGDPAVSRDEIGSGWAACTPALALYPEPPAGALTMGGARAPALGRSWGRRFAADCPQHERCRCPPHAGGAGTVKAAVPGKGGRRGGRQAWAGRRTPDPPGPAFCSPFWGRAIPCASRDEEGAGLRAGPGGSAGRLPRRSARRTVCSGDSEPCERSSPSFSAGGFRLRGAVAGVKSLRYSVPAGEFEAGTRGARSRSHRPSPAFRSTHSGSHGGNSGPS